MRPATSNRREVRPLLCALFLTVLVWANPADDLEPALMRGELQPIVRAVNANPGLIKVKMTGSTYSDDILLSRAAFWGHLDIVKFLVEKGSDVNHHGFVKSTPLEQAAFMGHPDVVKYLIAHKADLNAKGNIGGTPLHAAVFGDKLDCLTL